MVKPYDSHECALDNNHLPVNRNENYTGLLRVRRIYDCRYIQLFVIYTKGIFAFEENLVFGWRDNFSFINVRI